MKGFMKITIIIEHEDSENCLIHETDSFQGAIEALSGFAKSAHIRNVQHNTQKDVCPSCGEDWKSWNNDTQINMCAFCGERR